jgi:histidyl-tRNA synthetase
VKIVQPVRGTKDLLFNELRQQHAIIEHARHRAMLAGFQGIETPIFESTDVFYRLGETSDVVSKETYTFQDRGGDSLTLRPEGTAPVVRALLSNGLTQSMPLKLFYEGPMFRYDRPQKGRYRQFTQIGVESFGTQTYHADIECLMLAENICTTLGIRDQIELQINTLGDAESRAAYREKLIDYFARFKNDLSEDSKRRLELNPLRILDSKDEGDKKIVQEAPLYRHSLSTASKGFFDQVLNALEMLNIPYVQDDRLVRGLDYYCHTTFEYVTKELGSQGTVLAGGRYDGLVQEMGGPVVPGIGWAAGVERLALLAQMIVDTERPVIILPLGEKAELKAFTVAADLMHYGLTVDTLYTGNLGKRLKKATRVAAKYAVIFGEEELEKGVAQVRDLDQSSEEMVAFDLLPGILKGKFA